MTIPFNLPLSKLTNRRLLLGCYVAREKWFRQRGELFRGRGRDETNGNKLPYLFRGEEIFAYSIEDVSPPGENR